MRGGASQAAQSRRALLGKGTSGEQKLLEVSIGPLGWRGASEGSGLRKAWQLKGDAVHASPPLLIARSISSSFQLQNGAGQEVRSEGLGTRIEGVAQGSCAVMRGYQNQPRTRLAPSPSNQTLSPHPLNPQPLPCDEVRVPAVASGVAAGQDKIGSSCTRACARQAARGIEVDLGEQLGLRARAEVSAAAAGTHASSHKTSIP